MQKQTRPHKTWYRVRCVVCGTYFLTHRFHAQFHSATCRQRYHRNGNKPYERSVKIVGRGQTNPLSPTQQDPVAVLHTDDERFSGLLKDFEKLVPAVDRGDLVERELFIQGFDQAAVDPPANSSAELKPTVTDLPSRPTVAGERQYRGSELQRQVLALGLVEFPVDRKAYEIARKRVYNLLNARGRDVGTKRYLKSCWIAVQDRYYLLKSSA